MFIPTDIAGKVIKVGDIVSSPSLDYGSTFRVVKVDSWRLHLVRAFRGRKVVIVDFSNFRVVG